MKPCKYLFSVLILLFSCNLCAQQKATHIREVVQLNQRFDAGMLDQEEYLFQIDSLLLDFFHHHEGNIASDSLIKLLKNYHDIVSSEKSRERNKAMYYGHLATNSNLGGRGSEAIFYAGKHVDIYKKNNKTSLLQLGMIFTHYHNSRNFSKIIESFEVNEGYINNLFEADQLSVSDRINLSQFIAFSTEAYKETNQLSKATATIEKLRKMTDILDLDERLNYNDQDKTFFTLAEQEVKLALAFDKPEVAKTFIEKMNQYFSKRKLPLFKNIQAYKNKITQCEIAYFKHTNNFKEAQQLLSQTDSQRFSNKVDSVQFLKDYAFVESKTGNYLKAYNFLQNGIAIYENQILDLTNQMDELLYAHAEAEFNRNELDHAQKEKRYQLYWMLGIGLLLITLLVTSIVWRLKEKRKTQATILQLNRLTDVMVEEAKKEAAKEEKRKLGQDLHDDLSGSLASLLHVIKGAELETKEPELSDKLEQIFGRTSQIYERIRKKSHVMYDLSENAEGDSLGQNIQKIVDTALPDKDFAKEVEIDPAVSILLPSTTRIEVLRIVQEAINNILKHAKKASNVFVFLYKEMNTVTLQISDDGKQTTLPSKGKGIGLDSIANRVHTLGGQLKIDTESGMNLTIMFPLV